ncbi:MAG: response regulator, partial [Acidobacteria bacterium]|nr:response regulator [Acidobacteriota bacterium]
MTENKRLLVVDDEAEFCEVLQDILEARGFTVDTASNGKEALKMMEKHPANIYSVLIADINMPEMGGIELIRQVAVKYPFVIPVIVTGYADTQAAVESLRVGAYDFISKPF